MSTPPRRIPAAVGEFARAVCLRVLDKLTSRLRDIDVPRESESTAQYDRRP